MRWHFGTDKRQMLWCQEVWHQFHKREKWNSFVRLWFPGVLCLCSLILLGLQKEDKDTRLENEYCKCLCSDTACSIQAVLQNGNALSNAHHYTLRLTWAISNIWCGTSVNHCFVSLQLINLIGLCDLYLNFSTVPKATCSHQQSHFFVCIFYGF